VQPLLSPEKALTVTPEDRRRLKAFLNPRWGTDNAGTTTTPFLFVKAQAPSSGRGSVMIRSVIYVTRDDRSRDREATGGSHDSLHAALLHSLKVLIPDKGEGMKGRPEDTVRAAAVAYLEGRVAGMRGEAGEAGAAATSDGGKVLSPRLSLRTRPARAARPCRALPALPPGPTHGTHPTRPDRAVDGQARSCSAAGASGSGASDGARGRNGESQGPAAAGGVPIVTGGGVAGGFASDARASESPCVELSKGESVFYHERGGQVRPATVLQVHRIAGKVKNLVITGNGNYQ
jgi:hypothetical protein